MFYEILHPKVKLDAQKRLRCKPTLLGKHFVLVSQNLEYKMPELLSFYLTGMKKRPVEKNADFQRYLIFFFFFFNKKTHLGHSEKGENQFLFQT